MILRWLPAAAILGGLITRVGSDATWVIKPCLMLIMFAAFVETRALKGWRLSRFLGLLVAFQVVAGGCLFLLLLRWSETAALAGLLIALTPTAVSAAAVASGVRADVRLVTSTIAASNLIACVTFPLAMAAVEKGPTSLASALSPAKLVGMTVVLPFLAAWIVVNAHPGASRWSGAAPWKVALRTLWAAILWVSASKVGAWYSGMAGGTFVDYSWPVLLGAALFGLFALFGYALGTGKRTEAVICFGHKNTGLALLLILSSFPVAVAAAVLFYSLVQNVVFSVLDYSRGQGN